MGKDVFVHFTCFEKHQVDRVIADGLQPRLETVFERQVVRCFRKLFDPSSGLLPNMALNTSPAFVGSSHICG